MNDSLKMSLAEAVAEKWLCKPVHLAGNKK